MIVEPCPRKALLEMGKIDEAIQRHKIEVRVGKQSGISELKIRAMDNLAVSICREFSLAGHDSYY